MDNDSNFFLCEELQQCQHEVESSTEGEAGLVDNYRNCKKNPGHANFIPVSEFSMEHLPADYPRDADLYNLVKTLADLTVRVSVNYTSENRPDFHGRLKSRYPFCERKGQSDLRTGTGRIWGVRKYQDGRCPCRKCKASPAPSRTWGRVFLYTATHVVFDNSEGCHTEVAWGLDKFRHDAAVAEGAGAGVVYDPDAVFMEGVGAGIIGDMERDKCTLTSVTCNVDLLDKLAKLVAQYKKYYVTLYDKYSSPGREDRLTVVVSHPHGCEKAVTFGRWTSRRKFSDKRGLIDTTYTYTAETCPGSSGAPVYVLGRVWYTLNHSGTSSLGNFSGGGW